MAWSINRCPVISSTVIPPPWFLRRMPLSASTTPLETNRSWLPDPTVPTVSTCCPPAATPFRSRHSTARALVVRVASSSALTATTTRSRRSFSMAALHRSCPSIRRLGCTTSPAPLRSRSSSPSRCCRRSYRPVSRLHRISSFADRTASLRAPGVGAMTPPAVPWFRSFQLRLTTTPPPTASQSAGVPVAFVISATDR